MAPSQEADNIDALEADAQYNPDRGEDGEETVEGIEEALANLSD